MREAFLLNEREIFRSYSIVRKLENGKIMFWKINAFENGFVRVHCFCADDEMASGAMRKNEILRVFASAMGPARYAA